MKPTFNNLLKLCAATLTVGLAGGAVGAVFSLLVHLVTSLRTSFWWLLLFLPLGGVAVVFLYKQLRLGGQGIGLIFSNRGRESVSPILPVGIIGAATVSHLVGASVGREGAALQIGAGLSVPIAKWFRLENVSADRLLDAGMAAVFAALFGTPLAAMFFVLEIVTVGTLRLKSALPALVASLIGYGISQLCGIHPERFAIPELPSVSFDTVWKLALVTLLTALLSIVFCYALRHTAALAKKVVRNPYLRIALGGALVLLMTTLVGAQTYNGAGMNIVERIFHGEAVPLGAFALKLLFTCVSVAAGFKGGEIVPTLFIGATLGALLGTLLGLPLPFCAALCMVLLFCGVTNCPIASLCLGLELFSGVGFWYFVCTVPVCFVLSGKISLYSEQNHKYKYL